MAGTLYLVPTPIGNLGDVTPRAREVLAAVSFVACEDTRVGGKLLTLLAISKPLMTYFEHNKVFSGAKIIARLLAGEDVALITDAGTPAVSDPGEDLVRLCHEEQITVIPLAGACAATTAISASGLPSRRFTFEGFLPEGNKERREYALEIATEKRTMIFYSAPHDLRKTLEYLYKTLGERETALCKELTKRNEKVTRGPLSALCESVNAEETIRGEYVIVVSGYTANAQDAFWYTLTLEEHVKHYVNLGLTQMDAVRAAAKDRGVAKNVIYKEVNRKQPNP